MASSTTGSAVEPAPVREGLPGVLGCAAAEDTNACVGHHALCGEPLPRGSRLTGPALGEPAPMVLGGEGLCLAVAHDHEQTSSPRGTRGRIGRRWAHLTSLSPPLRLPVMPLGATVQPGAERRPARHRRGRGQARQAHRLARVRRARRRRRRPASRWSRRPPRSGPRSSRSTTPCSRRLGAAEVYGVRPRTAPRPPSPEVVQRARPGDRHLHDRRQPAEALHGDRRHARSARRSSRRAGVASPSAAPRPAPASSPRTWSPSAPAARRRSSG